MARRYLSNEKGDVIIRMDETDTIIKVSVVHTPLFTNYQYNVNKVNYRQKADIDIFYKKEVSKKEFLELVAKCVKSTLSIYAPDANLQIEIPTQP